MKPEAVSAMRRWAADPAAFCREVLQVDPDAWQVTVCEAAATKSRVCLKASKGPGKSAVLAMLAWWYLVTRPHPKVICTSITGDNLRDGLWAELAKWQQRSEFLKAAFTWSAERIVANDHPETWFASARKWSQAADSSQQANTLAGIHADHVLFVVDEAGGIPDAVVAAAEAGLANADESQGREAKLLLAGNPTHLEGPLYRACTRERHLWYVYEISGDPDDPNRAPRISVQWAREQIEKYGAENPWVLVNVFGRFPPSSQNALLGVDDVTAATRRVVVESQYRDSPKVLGVDVARFGDDRTVFVLRQGCAVFRPKVFRNLTTMEVASQLAFFCERHQPAAVFVDNGSFGAGVVDRARELGLNVIGVDFGGKALGGKYANRRAEMWAGLAEWVATGALPRDEELIGELVAPTYSFDKHGKLLLEPKEFIKKRLGKSPDLGDALALTFAAPVARPDVGPGPGARQTKAVTEYDPFKEAA